MCSYCKGACEFLSDIRTTARASYRGWNNNRPFYNFCFYVTNQNICAKYFFYCAAVAHKSSWSHCVALSRLTCAKLLPLSTTFRPLCRKQRPRWSLKCPANGRIIPTQTVLTNVRPVLRQTLVDRPDVAQFMAKIYYQNDIGNIQSPPSR